MDELYAVPNFKLRAFATGDYSCKCRNCGAEFTGHKRALICLPCALNQGDKRDKEISRMDKQHQDLDTGAWHWTDEYVESLEAEVERLEKWQDALRQRLHMAEEQIRECRQYLRLDDRNLVVGHIDAYFALPALQEGKQD